MNELQLCPACGGVATLTNGFRGVFAVCVACGYKTPDYKSAETAIRVWNSLHPFKLASCTKSRAPESMGCACEINAKAAEEKLNDLLYVIRANMTSITRYVRYKREAHPTLTEGQSLDRQLEYKELAEKAVTNILEYINGGK